jgi:hypothetical protein
MKKDLSNLVGEIVQHKKFGSCEVIKVVNGEEGKIMCKILDSGESKTLVFSKQFFNNVSDYETKNIELKPIKKQKHKEVNYLKYRNHPLVKEIDRKEFGYKAPVMVADSDDEEESEMTDEA